jgi:hypothetical protein
LPILRLDFLDALLRLLASLWPPPVVEVVEYVVDGHERLDDAIS